MSSNLLLTSISNLKVLGYAVALFVTLALPGSAFAFEGGNDYYRSSDGTMVHVPYRTTEHVPGETAVCEDGTHSVSHHHQGTCSHHGGVDHFD